MDKLIELLKQIQDLAGVAIDALQGAAKDAGHKPEEGGKPPEEGSPEEEHAESPAQEKGEMAAGEKPGQREPAPAGRRY